MSIGIGDAFRRNRQVRMPVNEYDKSTVFSILPKPVEDIKVTVERAHFFIPIASPEKPERLVVGASNWWREIDVDQPLLEIPVSSPQLAESIVRDYINGMVMCDMGENRPGLFWLPGDISIAKLLTEHKAVLEQAKTRQMNWFKLMVKLADVLWARTNGNPLSVSDDSRLAATHLKIVDRPWLMDFKTALLENCPACGTLRNNNFPVCANCKSVIDRKKFEELGLKFAS